jgi:hypothetical protein
MEWPLVLFAAMLALLAGAFIASGLLGRASGELPVCSRCGVDGRPAFLHRRACACGADLSRAGAIRLIGVRRSARGVVVGALHAAAAFGVLAFGLSNARKELRAVDHAPLWVLTTGLASSAEWARASLERRMNAGLVRPELASRIVMAANRGIEAASRADARPLRFGRVTERLAFLIPPTEPLAEEFVLLTSAARLERSGKGVVRSGDEVVLRLTGDERSPSELDMRFHRIDEVTLEGEPIAWRLRDRFRPELLRSLPLMMEDDELVITLPKDLAPGRHAVSVRVTSGWCDVPLEFAATAGPIEEWNAGVRAARHALVVQLTIDGPTPEVDR